MRIHNWDVYLALWASDLIGKPFAWGSTDCAKLLQVSQQIIHGEDLWPEIKYSTREEALRILVEIGGIKNQLLAKGAVQQRLSYVQTGDIMLTEAEDPLLVRCLIVVADKALITEEDSLIYTVPVLNAPGEVYRIE